MITKDMVDLYNALEDSIKDCIRQGDLVAVQLSGGLDSAIIQSIAKSEHLYCCTWDEQDNITQAKKASFGSEVKPVTFTKQQMLDVLPRVKKITDGKGTWSQVCQYFLCQQIAKDGCDTVLSGEGADELFGGYSRYRVLYHLDQMFNDPRLANYQGIIERVVGSKKDIVKRMLCRSADELTVVKEIYPDIESTLEECIEFDRTVHLPKLLTYGERMAHEHGLKCFFPFMDVDIQEIAMNLPSREKVNQVWSKSILRLIAIRLKVDYDIIDEKTKKGLFIPQSWRPKNEPLWSTKWFEDLIEKA